MEIFLTALVTVLLYTPVLIRMNNRISSVEDKLINIEKKLLQDEGKIININQRDS
ncbi:hypothetical protein [Cytobacillus sp. IB215665]|uniref:hypothetical protein n=1 Tax=Cytobacillus sp. IB215665 TaxID=3097357 RepID=UPI002A184CAF|nr:hypothetical protein [Cytobacillus sp. IB215665]MDX8366181.1 hypothetical protein [Cytobacillus sp. IB215665]